MIKNKFISRKKITNKKRLSYLIMILLIFSIANFTLTVNAQGVKFCCEKTTYGAWCQNDEEKNCNAGYRKTPTSCEATSYCKLGCCYDSSEGICMENTPQKVCQEKKGTWSEGKQCDIPQCNLGCCILGTQASFVTLTRCKKLSSFYGLLTNFRRDIRNELECISLASLQDEGACVYDLDYRKTCKFTSRQECNTIKEGVKIKGKVSEQGTVTGNVEFFKDMLCSAEELGTDCGLTKETTCVEGKDEVYFVDSCGNPANIYDSSKVNDKAYWRKKVSKEGSCNSNSANINSKTCGNCDYFSGSICGKASVTNRATYGNYVCRDLNCKSTTDGAKKHGESWCSTDSHKDAVGSRYFRHLCMNGEEIIEPCADFRQEICIQDKIESKGVSFSQAACRVNRWQDCYSQTEKIDCENKDKRDCIWILKGKEEIKQETIAGEKIGAEGTKPAEVACVPEHAPGLTFWEEGEAQGICSLANIQCTVVFKEKCLIGKHEDCEENCECMTVAWELEQLKKCEALGDCGSKVNWIGSKGSKEGYKVTRVAVEEEEGGGGGLLG